MCYTKYHVAQQTRNRISINVFRIWKAGIHLFASCRLLAFKSGSNQCPGAPCPEGLAPAPGTRIIHDYPTGGGPERLWSENALVLASRLVSPGAVAYWSALRFWNLTEQIPQVQFIQTTKRKRAIVIQGVEFRFIHVAERYFFGTITRQIADLPITVTDREKTIIDAASRPELSGGILQLAQAMKSAVNIIDWDKLEHYLIQWGGGVVAKRLGYLVETLSLPIPAQDVKTARWQAMISKGISQLEPGSGRTGPVVTRWQLQINVALEPQQH